MKKNVLIIILPLFLLNSCMLALLLPESKELKKTVEYVKNSYFEGYIKHGTIDEIFKQKSEYHQWYTGQDVNECNCYVQFKYADSITYETMRVKLIFYFRYNKNLKKTKIYKIYELNSNREYSTIEGVNYILNTIILL